ncbi:hypothetical protein BU26DRAFT_502470 [Trematosphaeria pertusa]|uniref:Uncharacterized protein n=1 Tax=Trematosphaeria pertusa TaxID=390896 RepID=A0A6A6IQU1_9PLEO|nr:uncharacterized protein BU26DRAFT_502470 [Trematosphaeria pertusa]KAF2251893.1 hypothetical protein BU26DRAFT_502470 [Trematosphaeria pertusa]
MSQFPSAPPPGAYAPPNQNAPPAQGFNPQQQQYYQPQGSSPYQSSAPSYGPPAQSHQSHKPTAAFGQMLNQAVTTGKPMLNKLGKTISSKLGSKQSAQTTPQHLESYHSYQQHQQQNQPPNYQQQGQQFSPQPQQQQSAYQTPQQSPFPQSNYGTPASGNSAQSNYFPQQTPQSPNPQAAPQQPNAGYNPNMFAQGGNAGGQPQGQPPQGQFQQGQFSQGSAEGQNPQAQAQPGQFAGQQTGVVGSSQTQLQNTTAHSPHPPNASPNPNVQPVDQQQQQWAPPTPAANQTSSPPPQTQHFNPSPLPHTAGAAPPVPIHPNQQQQQQWAPMSPMTPHAQTQHQIPPSVSPPPAHLASQNQPHAPSNAPPGPQEQQQSQPPTPAPQNAAPQSAPTAFIAELPADLGSLTLVESSNPQRPPSNPPGQGSQYQAYRPSGSQSQSPGPGFTIPRRAVSMSTLPLADPWRFADPATELPTREFYIIADLVFDALDRKFEPQATGMLEASKILESWKAQGLADDAAQLFAYDSYSAFAKLWSLEQIPHVMVPCQASLMPIWNFQHQSHSQDIKIPTEPASANSTYPTYMPALNRAGWYKYFFLEMCHQPESLDKVLQTFCADTYKPGVLNQPDIQKRDQTPLPALASRAAAIGTGAVSRVCEEIAAAMQRAQPGAAQGQPGGGTTQQEAALKLHGLQMQQQFNNMANQTMLQGGISFSTAAGNTYKPNYGSFV